MYAKYRPTIIQVNKELLTTLMVMLSENERSLAESNCGHSPQSMISMFASFPLDFIVGSSIRGLYVAG